MKYLFESSCTWLRVQFVMQHSRSTYRARSCFLTSLKASSMEVRENTWKSNFSAAFRLSILLRVSLPVYQILSIQLLSNTAFDKECVLNSFQLFAILELLCELYCSNKLINCNWANCFKRKVSSDRIENWNNEIFEPNRFVKIVSQRQRLNEEFQLLTFT